MSSQKGRGNKVVALLIASIVRDFKVVEERERVFGTKKINNPRIGRRQSKSRIVYIPKIRYSAKPSLKEYEKEFNPTPRQEHGVVPHLRKAGIASKKQLLLAMRHGFRIPSGFTFVRPHKRGGKVSEEKKIIYRSKSVLNILYDAECTTIRDDCREN